MASRLSWPPLTLPGSKTPLTCPDDPRLRTRPADMGRRRHSTPLAARADAFFFRHGKKSLELAARSRLHSARTSLLFLVRIVSALASPVRRVALSPKNPHGRGRI